MSTSVNEHRDASAASQKAKFPLSTAPLWVSPGDGPISGLRQALGLLKVEGPQGLARGLGRFSTALWHRVYHCESLRLYEVNLAKTVLVDVAPPAEDIQFRVIETREDVEQLIAEGCEDIVLAVPCFSSRLGKGAVAACAFIGSELASIDWMAFSETAKLSFDQRPYRVDFANGEVCTGGAFTVRRFRRRGIATCRFSRQVQYMHERGCSIYRTAIRDDNIPSKRPVERYCGQVRRMGHWRRLLWSTSWKETELE